MKPLTIPIPEHVKPGDRVPQCSSQENVRREMGHIRNTGETDQSRHAVRHPRNPFMVAIAPRYDCTDRECRRGVSRRKATALPQQTDVTLEESVTKVVIRSHGRGPQPAAHKLYNHMRNCAIQIGLAR